METIACIYGVLLKYFDKSLTAEEAIEMIRQILACG